MGTAVRSTAFVGFCSPKNALARELVCVSYGLGAEVHLVYIWIHIKEFSQQRYDIECLVFMTARRFEEFVVYPVGHSILEGKGPEFAFLYEGSISIVQQGAN